MVGTFRQTFHRGAQGVRRRHALRDVGGKFDDFERASFSVQNRVVAGFNPYLAAILAYAQVLPCIVVPHAQLLPEVVVG